jgi:hypothetical protein
MTQSPQPKTFTNFELSISIRLDGSHLFELHQLIVMPHVCVMSPYPPKADIRERRGGLLALSEAYCL